jgi:hypothetical protein
MSYDPGTMTLAIGEGRISPVAPASWAYEVSGMRVVKRWFDRRKNPPDGRRSSPLDDIVTASWPPEWTTELLEVLNVLAMLTDIEPDQASLLRRVVEGPTISVDRLTADGVLPVSPRPGPEKPGRSARLFD